MTELSPGWFGMLVSYNQPNPAALEGGRFAIAGLFGFFATLFIVLMIMLVLVIVRALTRRTWAAFLGAVIIASAIFASNPANAGPQVALLVVFALALVALLMRFGLLAALAALFLHAPVSHGVMTGNLNSWYADGAFAGLFLLAAVGVYGFIISFGGRSLLGEHAFED